MELLAIEDIGVGWQTVIQAAIAAVVAIALGWLQHRTKKAVEDVAEKAAEKVEVVKSTLVDATVLTTEKLDHIADKVEEVHKATNSMKDELVKKTEIEALARGGAEEKARADALKVGEMKKDKHGPA